MAKSLTGCLLILLSALSVYMAATGLWGEGLAVLCITLYTWIALGQYPDNRKD